MQTTTSIRVRCGRVGLHQSCTLADICTLLLVLVLICMVVSLPRSASAQGAGAEWTTPSGTPQGTRYSELTQITSANAHSLVEEFAFATGTRASHEGQPLVVGHVMYIVTPFPDKLIALDLRTPGSVLWTFDPHARGYARGVACCDVDNRGAVYANGRIIYNTLDDATVAVDATTGKLIWRTRLGNPKTGETITGAKVFRRPVPITPRPMLS